MSQFIGCISLVILLLETSVATSQTVAPPNTDKTGAETAQRIDIKTWCFRVFRVIFCIGSLRMSG